MSAVSNISFCHSSVRRSTSWLADWPIGITLIAEWRTYTARDSEPVTAIRLFER